MTEPRAKKSQQIILRLEEGTDAALRQAVKASGLTITEALRLAANALIIASDRFGKIPRDMEIRQAQVGDIDDMKDLLRRAVAIGEGGQEPYLPAAKPPVNPPSKPGAKDKPPDKSQRHRGDGPRAKVS